MRRGLPIIILDSFTTVVFFYGDMEWKFELKCDRQASIKAPSHAPAGKQSSSSLTQPLFDLAPKSHPLSTALIMRNIIRALRQDVGTNPRINTNILGPQIPPPDQKARAHTCIRAIAASRSAVRKPGPRDHPPRRLKSEDRVSTTRDCRECARLISRGREWRVPRLQGEPQAGV